MTWLALLGSVIVAGTAGYVIGFIRGGSFAIEECRKRLDEAFAVRSQTHPVAPTAP